MPRSNTRFEGDQPFLDGQIFLSAYDAVFTGTGTPTYTNGVSGLGAINFPNTTAGVLNFSLSSLIFRYGVQDSDQAQFGSSAAGGAQGLPVGGYTTLTTASAAVGTNVNVQVINSGNFTVGRKLLLGGTQKTFTVAIPDATHITVGAITSTLASNSTVTENLFTTPAGVSGPAPYTSANQFTPVTAPRPKGLYVRAIYPVYALAGAAATTNTIGLQKTVFAPNVAPVVTAILATGANGLATATNAQPYITPIPIPTPAMLVTKYASYQLSWSLTTPGGGTAVIYGVFLDVAYNYA
jgi:hypothetical protein